MKSLRGLKIFQCEMLPLRMEIGRRARGEMEGREEITVPRDGTEIQESCSEDRCYRELRLRHVLVS